METARRAFSSEPCDPVPTDAPVAVLLAGSALVINRTHCSFARRIIAPLRLRGHRVVLFVVPDASDAAAAYSSASSSFDVSAPSRNGNGNGGGDDDGGAGGGMGLLGADTSESVAHLTFTLERLKRIHGVEVEMAPAPPDEPSASCVSSVQGRLTDSTRSARGAGSRI